MSKITDNINDVGDKIDNELNRFLEGVEKSQKGIFNKLLTIVKEVDISDGQIKQTVRNLKLLSRIRKTIENEILTDAYVKRSESLLNQFPAIASLNNGYFNVIESSFSANKELYKEVINTSIQATRNSLLGAGIDENVINPIVQIVDDSVTTGARYVDMIDELRVVIQGTDEIQGRLMRYSQQITTDGLNQFNGAYNQTIANDLDLEWFFYSGGVRATSRDFCKKRAGKYFHKKEIEEWANDKWQGKAKGTTKSSIFKYRGGYNCYHIFKPTTIDSVPKYVVNRVKKKGYID